MIYGYARVSTKGQARDGNSLEDQEQKLREKGAEIIFRDSFTGTQKHRPELDKLLGVIKEGDTLVVTRLDRIARTTIGGIELVTELQKKGVVVDIMNMGVVDNSPVGKLVLTVMLAFAEYERDMIVQRTQEGKEIAKQRSDWREGRKKKAIDMKRFKQLKNMISDGYMTVDMAAKDLGISRAKWYRLVKEIA